MKRSIFIFTEALFELTNEKLAHSGAADTLKVLSGSLISLGRNLRFIKSEVVLQARGNRNAIIQPERWSVPEASDFMSQHYLHVLLYRLRFSHLFDQIEDVLLADHSILIAVIKKKGQQTAFLLVETVDVFEDGVQPVNCFHALYPEELHNFMRPSRWDQLVHVLQKMLSAYQRGQNPSARLDPPQLEYAFFKAAALANLGQSHIFGDPRAVLIGLQRRRGQADIVVLEFFGNLHFFIHASYRSSTSVHFRCQLGLRFFLIRLLGLVNVNLLLLEGIVFILQKTFVNVVEFTLYERFLLEPADWLHQRLVCPLLFSLLEAAEGPSLTVDLNHMKEVDFSLQGDDACVFEFVFLGAVLVLLPCKYQGFPILIAVVMSEFRAVVVISFEPLVLGYCVFQLFEQVLLGCPFNQLVHNMHLNKKQSPFIDIIIVHAASSRQQTCLI